jgi:hypothetical protein
VPAAAEGRALFADGLAGGVDLLAAAASDGPSADGEAADALPQEKAILRRVSGSARPGGLTALMGKRRCTR